MANEIKTKKSFGSVQIDHFSPPLSDDVPKAINVHISFEEAMRLHLGLGQALAKLNSYDRSTKDGKRSAVNLCLYTQVERITINEGKVHGPDTRPESPPIQTVSAESMQPRNAASVDGEVTLKDIDSTIRRLTGEAELSRPFLCYGSPLGCEVAEVGINPGSTAPFWPYWSVETGCDKSGWLADHRRRYGRRKPTRENLEKFIGTLRPARCLELNLYDHYSSEESTLDDARKSMAVFDYMLQASKPKVLLVHGDTPASHIESLLGTRLRKGVFTKASYQGHSFEVFWANMHFRRLSGADVMQIARQIKKRLGYLASAPTEVDSNVANNRDDGRATKSDRHTGESPVRVAVGSHLGARMTLKQLRILKFLAVYSGWRARAEMEDKVGKKGFSAALGAPTQSIRPGTLEYLKYVERHPTAYPFEYRITDLGKQALSEYERQYGDVEFM